MRKSKNNKEEKGKLSERLKLFCEIIIAVIAVAGFIVSNYNFKKTLEDNNEKFEIVNRPIVQIANPSIKIIGKYLREDGILPEVKFRVDAELIVHDRIPAYIKNVDYVIASLDQKQYRTFMPFPEDKRKLWENFDLFPIVVMSIPYSPCVNVDDIKDIMQIDESFYNSIKAKGLEFWNNNDETVKSKLQGQVKPFYLIVQVEYYKIGDFDKKLNPYFYVVKFKFEDALKKAIFSKSTSGKCFEIKKSGEVKVLREL